MKETFKEVNLEGSIKINLAEKGEAPRYWIANKGDITRAIISICEEYKRGGYVLTLRQLYYQLVSKDLIPNHDKVYKKLSSLKDDVVYSGKVDWNIFEDRGRIPSTPYYEDSVADALEKTVRTYRLYRQLNQPTHVEVWTEKDAISSILKKVTYPMGITLVVNKGYSSSTAMYGAYERFIDRMGEGQKIHILYFGDHDPSGLDMVRDIHERLMFMFVSGERCGQVDCWKTDWSEDPVYMEEIIDRWAFGEEGENADCYEPECDNYFYDEDCRNKYEDGYEYFDHKKAFFKHHFKIQQIGLTMDQIREFNPPPNPAKITDPRAKDYIKQHGNVSWEVDALTPKAMERIVQGAIDEIIDHDIFEAIKDQEAADKDKIRTIVRNLNPDQDEDTEE